MGELIFGLQKRYRKKFNFISETKRMDENFEDLNSELSDLNLSFDSTLEELEAIDKELIDILS